MVKSLLFFTAHMEKRNPETTAKKTPARKGQHPQNGKLPKNRVDMLARFQEGLGIHFRNMELLDQAFHHRSYVNEAGPGARNNERLEFLGDSVLGLVTANFLYQTMQEHPEGDLAKIKSVVVSEMTLSAIAVRIGIDTCLCLGRGEEHSGGRSKKAILADAVEAVFGAYYLDSGFEAAEKLVLELLVPEIEKVWEDRYTKDYKTILQEWDQKQFKETPKYELVKITGPDHDRIFWVSVVVNGKVFGPETGKNKREAEQKAAKHAYEDVSKI